jgi:hypothetical protein
VCLRFYKNSTPAAPVDVLPQGIGGNPLQCPDLDEVELRARLEHAAADNIVKLDGP